MTIKKNKKKSSLCEESETDEISFIIKPSDSIHVKDNEQEITVKYPVDVNPFGDENETNNDEVEILLNEPKYLDLDNGDYPNLNPRHFYFIFLIYVHQDFQNNLILTKFLRQIIYGINHFLQLSMLSI